MADQKIKFYENGNEKAMLGYSANESLNIIKAFNEEKRKNKIIDVATTIIKRMSFALTLTILIGVTQINPKQFIKQKIIDLFPNQL